MCNKLASRHVRVGLADPTDVPRCDICENAPGMRIYYCPPISIPYENRLVFERMMLQKVYFTIQNSFAAFFYCEIDGSSLCLECDMIVHVGGKRKHGRYLMLRQRIEVCGS